MFSFKKYDYLKWIFDILGLLLVIYDIFSIFAELLLTDGQSGAGGGSSAGHCY